MKIYSTQLFASTVPELEKINFKDKEKR